MRRLLRDLCIGALLTLGAGPGLAQTPEQPPPVKPYVDPRQLNCPWPKHDHYLQPWRAYLETRSAYDMLQGIGIVQNHGDNIALADRLLAECGFKAFRMEVPFGSMKWDGSGLTNQDAVLTVLRDCKKYGIRPTLLMNAHHGVPCPVQGGNRKLAEPARKGDRTIKLVDAGNLRAGYSGLSNLTTFYAAQVIFTHIDPATGVCKLSKPLPVDIPAGKSVPVTTLKYRPLFPTGTPQYEESVRGFLHYVGLLIKICREAGISEYDLELWNELTFGSDWLDINHYYDPPLTPRPIDKLIAGGTCWELGRRVVDKVGREAPKDVRVIWGFSNITFHHTPIEQLPAGIDGQSYHPYGTGTRDLEFHEQAKDRPGLRQGPPPPIVDIRLPEGVMITFIQTECLLRHLSPAGRVRRPKETRRFWHYITEHGVHPPESDVDDEPAAWRLKQKAMLRAYSMWLNKGLDVMHWYSANSPRWAEFGILPVNMKSLPADARFDDVATPPMKAMRNFTRHFAGAVPIAKPTQLGVEITELTEPRKIFQGVPGYRSLWERECFAFLPFQVNATKFVIPVYIMTYDATRDHPGSRYRLDISGVPAGVTRATLYDPITDRPIDLSPTVRDGLMEIEVPVTDYPRLLTLDVP